ncbi:CBL-interacting protein kinase 25-like [Phragmites australis]|uniref:CBL-interacting protein kinase 25-like n=1 Tax=Phragmites australis TaxID=29695 RepID=UPI002D769FF2|nr:CBL-interacting protein kinase 25-like [Phragmites australis]
MVQAMPRLLMGRYHLGKLLGKGSFAKVYHARNVESGEEVAIKMMDKDHLAKTGAAQQQIMREIDIMRRVRHPNVVRIHEVMASKTRIFVVMEFVGGGSLHGYLVHRSDRGVGEVVARRVFHQLVSALDYCHSLGVYHRDIKPENILVDDKGNIKVADFGLSSLADTARQDALLHTICGTPMYIAPEVLARRGYDGAKADVWACGVVLFALAAGRLPFNHKDIYTMYHMICRSDYQCPPWFSAGLVRLIRRLLCPYPTQRITIPQIKETPWFKKGFKEINFYIGNDDRPRSLGKSGEPEQRYFDSDSDDDTTVSSLSSEDPFSPVAGVQHRGSGSRMHTSVSAPSLTTLEKTDSAAIQVHPRMRRPKSLNAFDIIASSPSFDLSGLFEEPGEQMRFVSAAPVAKIISKLEEIAGHVSFTARTKEYQVSIEETRNGLRGALLISTKIFEITPELVMVKVCKKAGDIAAYRQFCSNELKPGLRGLVDGLREDCVCVACDSE